MPAPNHVIIGIHGLSWKPPKDQHKAAWEGAICEGLRRNFGIEIRTDQLGFELVYWADWIDRADKVDDEPYVRVANGGPLPRYEQRRFDKTLAKMLDEVGDPVDWVNATPSAEWIRRHTGLDDVGVQVIQKRLVDLGTYYGNQERRAHLRKLLADALVKNEGKRIMLLAHSMGSIIAYDVLRDIGRERPGLGVDHLVTLGSPLGMPYVVGRIRQENPEVRTPSVVRRWTNLADRKDPVAIDVHLRDEYEPNGRQVAVEDRLVLNTYRSPADKRNPHKIYGYLITPEFSELVRNFI